MKIEEAVSELQSYKYDDIKQALKTKQTKKERKELYEQLKESIEKETKEEQILSEIQQKNQEITQRIDSLPEPYKSILFLKYICVKTIEEISTAINYSNKQIYQLHKEGLNLYASKYSNPLIK